MAVTKPKASTFSEIIHGDKPVLVDFYADWCGPCKMMNPVLKQVKRKMGDKIHIIKVDSEKNPAAAIRYNVRGVPTMVLIRNGKVLWQQAGVLQANDLETIINQKLRSS